MWANEKKRTNDSGFLSQLIVPAFHHLVKNADKHAFLVGWNIESFRCCIAFSCELPVERYQDLLTELQTTAGDMAPILATCSKSATALPTILGEWIPPNLHPTDYIPSEQFQSLGIWITLTQDSSPRYHSQLADIPKLCSIYSLGCLYTTSCYMIQYDPVDTDRLCCFSLDTTPSQNFSCITISSGGWSSSATFGRHRQQQRQHGHGHMSADGLVFATGTEVELIAAQVNVANDLKTAVHNRLAQLGLGSFFVGAVHSSRKAGSHPKLQRHILVTIVDQVLRTCCYSPARRFWGSSSCCIVGFDRSTDTVLKLFGYLWVATSRGLRNILENKGTFYSLSGGIGYWLGLRASLVGGGNIIPAISLADILLSAACVSERFALFELALSRCKRFARSSSWKESATVRQQLWVDVCSIATLVCIDVVLGAIAGLLLFRNTQTVVSVVSSVCLWMQNDLLTDAINWFDHAPGGVKLNPKITHKVGRVLMIVLKNYGKLVAFSAPIYALTAKLVACAGCLGFTTQLVIIIDLIRLLTLHIALMHRSLAWMHQGQIYLIYSMWQLFQGKKINILRNRVDSCEYDKYQLLFGTVLFAIVLFLLPSFAAFFFLFAFVQLLIILSLTVLWSIGVGIKEFPYYALAVCLWDAGPHPQQGLTHGAKFQLLAAEDDYKIHLIKRPVFSKIGHFLSVFCDVFCGFGLGKKAQTQSQSSGTDDREEKYLLISKGKHHVPHLSGGVPSYISGKAPNKTAGFSSLSPYSSGVVGGYTNNSNNYTNISNNYTTVHLHLSARPLTLWKLFSAYAIYWLYLPSKKGLLMKLFRGVLFGWPALDVQLIQATVDLSNLRPGDVGVTTAESTSTKLARNPSSNPNSNNSNNSKTTANSSNGGAAELSSNMKYSSSVDSSRMYMGSYHYGIVSTSSSHTSAGSSCSRGQHDQPSSSYNKHHSNDSLHHTGSFDSTTFHTPERLHPPPSFSTNVPTAGRLSYSSAYYTQDSDASYAHTDSSYKGGEGGRGGGDVRGVHSVDELVNEVEDEKDDDGRYRSTTTPPPPVAGTLSPVCTDTPHSMSPYYHDQHTQYSGYEYPVSVSVYGVVGQSDLHKRHESNSSEPAAAEYTGTATGGGGGTIGDPVVGGAVVSNNSTGALIGGYSQDSSNNREIEKSVREKVKSSKDDMEGPISGASRPTGSGSRIKDQNWKGVRWILNFCNPFIIVASCRNALASSRTAANKQQRPNLSASLSTTVASNLLPPSDNKSTISARHLKATEDDSYWATVNEITKTYDTGDETIVSIIPGSSTLDGCQSRDYEDGRAGAAVGEDVSTSLLPKKAAAATTTATAAYTASSSAYEEGRISSRSIPPEQQKLTRILLRVLLLSYAVSFIFFSCGLSVFIMSVI